MGRTRTAGKSRWPIYDMRRVGYRTRTAISPLASGIVVDAGIDRVKRPGEVEKA